MEDKLAQITKDMSLFKNMEHDSAMGNLKEMLVREVELSKPRSIIDVGYSEPVLLGSIEALKKIGVDIKI